MIEIESKSKWVKIIPIWIKYGSTYSKLYYADKIFLEKGILDSFDIIVFGKKKIIKIEDPMTYQITFNEKMLVIMFCTLILGFLSTLLLVIEKNSFYGSILIFIFLIFLIQQLIISHISVKKISCNL